MRQSVRHTLQVSIKAGNGWVLWAPIFETVPHVPQTGLKLTVDVANNKSELPILLHPHPTCWDGIPGPPHLPILRVFYGTLFDV